MENKKGGKLICMRPDSIIEARFKLTKKQNDILDMVFATIENDGKLEYEINVTKYAKLYTIQNQSHVYEDLKRATKTFEGKGFSIVNKINNKESRIYFSWFASIQYLDGEGKIIFELGNKLKQLLLEVKRAVYYKLEYTINFNCIYSKRLYYYLKLYEDTGKRIDNLDTLRSKLECPKSYSKYANFRRFVIEPAYEEINGSSDINFKYEEIKTKNKVTAIKFFIKLNKKDKVKYNQHNKYSSIELMKVKAIFDENITDLDAKKLLDSSSGNIDIIREKYEIAKNTKKIKNLIGWMITAIKENYKDNFEKIEANNFKQRTYDSKQFKDIERKLLGWDNIAEN